MSSRIALGDLRYRVSVQRPTESAPDASGGVTTTWTEHAVLWCARKRMQSLEELAEGSASEAPVTRWLFTALRVAEIRPNDSLVVNGERLNVIEGWDVDGLGMRMQIIAEAAPDKVGY